MRRQGRLRVAACCDSQHWGGAEVVLLRVLTHLSRSWDVVLVAVDGAIAERFAASLPGLEVLLVPPCEDRRDLKGVLRHLRAVRRARADVCLVNLRHPYAAAFLLWGALAWARVPTVAVEHLPLPTASGFETRLKRWTSERLSAHISVGEQAGRRLERIAGLPAGSIATVRNGVPWVDAAPLELPAGLGRPCLTWVGRLVHQKGVDVLIRAVALVPGLSLWIDGEGPLQDELEALSATLGTTDRVRFSGWGPNPRGVLASADLVAVAGRQEAWGLALVEALQAGRPLLATDLPENHELLRDAAAFYPVDDHEALATLLAERVHDPEVLGGMSRRSRAVAQSLPTVEQMVASYDLLLHAAVARGPRVRVPEGVLRALPAAPPVAG